MLYLIKIDDLPLNAFLGQQCLSELTQGGSAEISALQTQYCRSQCFPCWDREVLSKSYWCLLTLAQAQSVRLGAVQLRRSLVWRHLGYARALPRWSSFWLTHFQCCCSIHCNCNFCSILHSKNTHNKAWDNENFCNCNSFSLSLCSMSVMDPLGA